MFNNQNQTPPIYLPQTATTGMLPYHQTVDDTNQRHVADYNPMIRGEFFTAPGQSAFSVPQSSINGKSSFIIIILFYLITRSLPKIRVEDFIFFYITTCYINGLIRNGFAFFGVKLMPTR